MEEQIKYAIEQMRPILQQDGGDIEYVGFEEGVVKVRLQGHCVGCPGAQMTLSGIVEKILKENFPMVERVEAVN